MPKRGFVSASEIAGVLGVSPWKTAFQVWAWHARGVAIDESNERTEWGLRLQIPILQATAQAEALEIEANTGDLFVEHYDPDRKAGCTVDAWVRRHDEGLGVVEAKNVDRMQWLKGWTDKHAPVDIEIQLQHQIWCTNAAFGVIGCLVGGNELRTYRRGRNPKIIAEIEKAVAEFWAMVKSGSPPDPLGVEREIPVLAELYPTPTGYLVLDKLNDEHTQNLASMWMEANDKRTFYEKLETAAKVKLLALGAEFDAIRTSGFRVKVSRYRNQHGSMTQKIAVKRIDGDPPIVAPPVPITI